MEKSEKQAIVILLKQYKEIQKIRRKYDPGYEKYSPHITLASPFENINQNRLKEHIKDSIKNIKVFKLELQSLRKSPKEFYLYLLIKKGNDKIVKIHKNLYSKLLGKWLRRDIPYIPHVTLGVFKTKEQIDSAIKELREQKIEIKVTIDFICLLTLKKDYSIKSIKRFKLK